MTIAHDDLRLDEAPATVATMSMAAALNLALVDAIEADDDVVVFGEDVGALGGVFRITDGLTARFGEDAPVGLRHSGGTPPVYDTSTEELVA